MYHRKYIITLNGLRIVMIYVGVYDKHMLNRITNNMCYSTIFESLGEEISVFKVFW